MMKKNIKIVNIGRFFKKNLGKGNSDIAFSFFILEKRHKRKRGNKNEQLK